MSNGGIGAKQYHPSSLSHHGALWLHPHLGVQWLGLEWSRERQVFQYILMFSIALVTTENHIGRSIHIMMMFTAVICPKQTF